MRHGAGRKAWEITKNSVAYTNHTVLAEALECWPQSLFETLLPRIWQIIVEIAHRWQKQVEDFYHDPAKTEKLAIVWDGGVRMANLCIAGGMSVNGVSALHTEILRRDVFRDAYQMHPEEFHNVTNGVDHPAAGLVRSIPASTASSVTSPAAMTTYCIRMP